MPHTLTGVPRTRVGCSYTVTVRLMVNARLTFLFSCNQRVPAGCRTVYWLTRSYWTDIDRRFGAAARTHHTPHCGVGDAALLDRPAMPHHAGCAYTARYHHHLAYTSISCRLVLRHWWLPKTGEPFAAGYERTALTLTLPPA